MCISNKSILDSIESLKLSMQKAEHIVERKKLELKVLCLLYSSASLTLYIFYILFV